MLRTTTDWIETRGRRDFIFGGVVFCPDRAGRIRIDDVTSTNKGVRVMGFAVRPNPALSGRMMVGALDRTLAQAGLSSGVGTELTKPCGEAFENAFEVVSQLQAGTKTTVSEGFTIHYTSRGRHLELSYPQKIVLCVGVTPCPD